MASNREGVWDCELDEELRLDDLDEPEKDVDLDSISMSPLE